jgi:Fe-S cluster assembly protein SufD
MTALPTRRDESWRYSDLKAVASVWPVPAPERIEVAAGDEIARVIVQDAAPDVVAIHDYVVVLGAGARATFHVLNSGGKLGRVAIDVTLHEGAHFELGAAILGGFARRRR